MKYPVTTAIGDAGEFFFAFQIASVLKWPCRLFDIDIGIDAQVEIINDNRTSTGKFVAFQIKATSQDEVNCRYVSSEQLVYWRALDLPVFVVLVDFPKGEMYLHSVDTTKSYRTTKNGSVRIDFDFDKDRFCETSSLLIAAAATEQALSRVRKYLMIVHERVSHIRSTINDQNNSSDPPALIELMDNRYMFREELARAGALASSYCVGDHEYSIAEQDLNGAMQELREFMLKWKMNTDWDDHGDIAKFLDER